MCLVLICSTILGMIHTIVLYSDDCFIVVQLARVHRLKDVFEMTYGTTVLSLKQVNVASPCYIL